MGAAMASKQILADAQRRMIAEVNQMKPIDEDVTGDVNAVGAYMRDASRGKARSPGTGATFRLDERPGACAYTRSNFGF